MTANEHLFRQMARNKMKIKATQKQADVNATLLYCPDPECFGAYPTRKRCSNIGRMLNATRAMTKIRDRTTKLLQTIRLEWSHQRQKTSRKGNSLSFLFHWIWQTSQTNGPHQQTHSDVHAPNPQCIQVYYQTMRDRRPS